MWLQHFAPKQNIFSKHKIKFKKIKEKQEQIPASLLQKKIKRKVQLDKYIQKLTIEEMDKTQEYG